VFARLAVDPFERGVVLIQDSEALRNSARGGANIVIPLGLARAFGDSDPCRLSLSCIRSSNVMTIPFGPVVLSATASAAIPSPASAIFFISVLQNGLTLRLPLMVMPWPVPSLVKVMPSPLAAIVQPWMW
jgi:hypothetical protein